MTQEERNQRLQTEKATRYIVVGDKLLLVPQVIVDEAIQERNRAYQIISEGAAFKQIEDMFLQIGKKLVPEGEPSPNKSMMYLIKAI